MFGYPLCSFGRFSHRETAVSVFLLAISARAVVPIGLWDSNAVSFALILSWFVSFQSIFSGHAFEYPFCSLGLFSRGDMAVSVFPMVVCACDVALNGMLDSPAVSIAHILLVLALIEFI